MKIKTAVFALLVSSFFLASAYAESDIKEGYDENTEITLKGTVVETVKEMRGPVIVRLRYDDKIYSVITAPLWYLSQEGIRLSPGSELEVRGAKYFGRDGNLYIISRQLKDSGTGKVFALRDEMCRPAWMGRGKHNRHMAH